MFKCRASYSPALLLFYTFPPFLLRLFSHSITALLNIPSSSFIPSFYSHSSFIPPFCSHCFFLYVRVPSFYSHSTFIYSLHFHFHPLPSTSLFYTFSHSRLLFCPLLQFTCKFLFCFMGNSVKSLD
jgi:hypothetical protein